VPVSTVARFGELDIDESFVICVASDSSRKLSPAMVMFVNRGELV
jgi:hypothetical protein